VEHQRLTGLLQLLKILEWKWEEIGMDFTVGLPHTQVGYDSIWVIMDRLTKASHFIPFKKTYSRAKHAELYMSRIVCLHGVPKQIIVGDTGRRPHTEGPLASPCTSTSVGFEKTWLKAVRRRLLGAIRRD
jgi:hypothetical protein